MDHILELLANTYNNQGRLGSCEKDVQDIDVLGRVLRLHSWSVTWEADARHRKAIFEQFGFTDTSKALTKYGYKASCRQRRMRWRVWRARLRATRRQCRALAARLNYLAQDNACIQFPATEISRSMANPAAQDVKSIQTVARFLNGDVRRDQVVL